MCTLRSLVRPLLTVVLAFGVVLHPGPAASLGTAFTYQGQLQQSGLPASGSCDMQFSLFNAASRGVQIGSAQVALAVNVTNGLFTVPLDFGSVFTGIELYLEIQVRCPAGGGSYVILSPRQHLTGAPYALYAPTAGNLSCSGCVTAGDLASGAVTGSAIASGAIDKSQLNFAPVLSVGAMAPLASSSGQNPSISLTGIVSVLNGGTGASTPANARTNLGAAASGDNGDITSLHGITGNITLPASTNSVGNIWKAGMLFLHNYGTGNIFLGNGAGNLSLTGSYNTAVGSWALTASTAGSDNTAVGTSSLQSNTTGHDNTAVGTNALRASTQGYDNTAVGSGSLQYDTTGHDNTAVGGSSLFSNTSGYEDTAVGPIALYSNTTGYYNTAVGSGALNANTTGHDNTALGRDALNHNLTYDSSQCTGAGMPYPCCRTKGSGACEGNDNTAVGSGALLANTTGYDNTAVGEAALSANTTGNANTALGKDSLGSNTTGTSNTAVGPAALRYNIAGSSNTAIGNAALYSNTAGGNNTAVGASALLYNNTGTENTAVGQAALVSNNGNYNTAVGTRALGANTTITGDDNTALGWQALVNNTGGGRNIAIGVSAGSSVTMEHDDIDIGNHGVGGESGSIRIGTPGIQTATYISGISGATCSGGETVYINADGKLGTLPSSARFKDDIRDMGDASSGVLKLRPVRFRYKPDIDPSGLEQYGLVAEEVAKVYPDLVVYDDKDQPQSVRYHFVNAMLLNEVQKQARQIETQREQIAVQARQMKAQAQQLEALAARLGRVEAALR